MLLKRLKLSSKLFIGFSLMIGFTVIISALSIYRLYFINREIQELGDIDTKKLTLSYELKEYIDEMSIIVRDIAISNDKNYMNEQKAAFDEDRSIYEKNSKELENLLTTENGREIFKSLEDNKEKLFSAFDEVVSMSMKENVTNEELQLVLNKILEPQKGGSLNCC